MDFERIVNETVLSGVAPVNLRYFGVFNGYDERPEALKSQTSIFTSQTGVIEDLSSVTGERGARLTIRNIVHAIRFLQELSDKDVNIEWISVQANVSLLDEEDVYSALKSVVDAEKCASPEKIRLEFPVEVFDLDRDKVKKGFSDVKASGLGVAISPITAEFALPILMDVPVDHVVLSQKLTALATDRNKTGVLTAIIALLHTMGLKVVADGVANDDEIRELTAVECFGFIPAPEYKGEFMLPLGAMEKGKIKFDEE